MKKGEEMQKKPLMDKKPGLAGQVLIFIGSIILVAGLGYVDIKTGYEISFSIFYLIPVAVTSWFVSGKIVYVMPVLAAVMWGIADYSAGHVYSSLVIPFWNMVMRLLIFWIVSALIRRTRRSIETEQALARMDTLTGMGNGRYFHDVAEHELNNAKRYGRPLSILYMDLDNFKKVNDLFGHTEGDDALKTISGIFKAHIRKSDIAVRMGGDEFVILLPNTDGEQAKPVITKITTRINEVAEKKHWPVSVSAGVISILNADISLDELITKADCLMYEVKNSGKNGVRYENIAAKSAPKAVTSR
jgi:diguanylate cyclase (GGDEF)-like protein